MQEIIYASMAQGSSGVSEPRILLVLYVAIFSAKDNWMVVRIQKAPSSFGFPILDTFEPGSARSSSDL